MCGCDLTDGEMCDVWHTQERTARKEWRCIECGTAILPGSRYRCVSTLYDGSWSRSSLCLRCAARYDEWDRRHAGPYLLGELAGSATLKCHVDCQPYLTPSGKALWQSEQARERRLIETWATGTGLLVKWLFEDDEQRRRQAA